MPPTHTPGPWRVCKDQGELEVWRHEPNEVPITRIARISRQPIPSEHGDHVANAQLIADVPELLRILDAAASALSVEHNGERDCEICQTLREANDLLRKHGYGPEPDALEQERSNATKDRSADE